MDASSEGNSCNCKYVHNSFEHCCNPGALERFAALARRGSLRPTPHGNTALGFWPNVGNRSRPNLNTNAKSKRVSILAIISLDDEFRALNVIIRPRLPLPP